MTARRRAVDRPAAAVWAHRALVLLALALGLVAAAGWVVAPLPLTPDLVRRLGAAGISGLAARRAINALVWLVLLGHVGPALLLLRSAAREDVRPRAGALALLLLGAAGLAAGSLPPFGGWLLVVVPAALLLTTLAAGEPAARWMGAALALSLLLFLLLAAVTAASPLAGAPGRVGGLDSLMAFPLVLLLWLPLPLVVGGALLRGRLWTLSIGRPSVQRGRQIAIAALAGAVTGAVAFGVGSRLAMRAIALLAGIPTEFTVEGTSFLILSGTLFGASLGGLYGLWLPPGGRRPVAAPAAALAVLLALSLLLAPAEGELLLVPRPITVALFAVLPLLFGAMFAPLRSWIARRLPAAQGGWGWLYAVGGVAGLMAAGMMLIPFWELAVNVSRAVR